MFYILCNTLQMKKMFTKDQQNEHLNCCKHPGFSDPEKKMMVESKPYKISTLRAIPRLRVESISQISWGSQNFEKTDYAYLILAYN